MISGDLGTALDQLRRGTDYERSKATGGAGTPHFRKGSRELGRVVEGGEGAVVGYEKNGVESAIT